MARIELTDASVTFTVRPHKRVTLKEYLVRGLFRGSLNPAVAVHALSGINLTARDGDRVGVIGHNGAGKSTLLKLLAGIYPPTHGSRRVDGKICSLFDISLGFEPEASGWDNITYRAYLQGETPASLKGKLEGIAAFTELGDFLDLPVRHYSAGMSMRLAFSIATAIEPEILLVDEVLAVGDLSFQHKAQARMKEMMASARVMVIVAHDLTTIRDLCTTVVWMEQGQVRMQGKPDEVIKAYVGSVNRPPAPAPAPPPAA
ncbi:MAG TPA: ABC transporter ATP-binding protein, partial [Urbifossiella sp.]|nr:ABC transporter ATP-binding protein [Urbifossiella sp.]